MEWLEELLKEVLPDNEEVQKAVVEKTGAYINENYVSSETYNNTKSEFESVQANMTEMETKFKDLANSQTENEELKSKITEITNEYDSFKSETELRELNRKKTSLVTKALTSQNANPEAMDLLITDFNLDELEIGEDGKINGLDDLVENVKQNRKSLFGTVEVNSVGAVDKNSDDGEYQAKFGRNR